MAIRPSAVPARANRITFYEAELKIERGWTKKQVRDLLGPPDDIVPSGKWAPRDEERRYGAGGHLALPTLGTVYFSNGLVDGRSAVSQAEARKVEEVGSLDPMYPLEETEPPPMSLMSDEELSRHLRILDVSHSEFGSDPSI